MLVYMTMMTIADFVTAHRIRLTATRADRNPHMTNAREMDHWRVTLRGPEGRMSLVYSQGYGFKGAEPTVADVLSCLASDAASIENANDFDEWARELGYSTDSRTAEKTYRATERQVAGLKRILGDDAYHTLLWELEQ